MKRKIEWIMHYPSVRMNFTQIFLREVSKGDKEEVLTLVAKNQCHTHVLILCTFQKSPL